MSSTIDVTVMGAGGVHISHLRFTVDYGSEAHHVLVMLDEAESTDDVSRLSLLEVGEILMDSGVVGGQRKLLDA